MAIVFKKHVRLIALLAFFALLSIIFQWERAKAQAPLSVAPATSSTRAESQEPARTETVNPREVEAVLMALQPRIANNKIRDVFAEPAPPPVAQPKVAKIVATPVEAVPPPPPAPPTLPFRYVGSMVRDGQLRVFLSRGETDYTVAEKEVIDRAYEVVSISRTEIIFNYLPLNVQQSLSLSTN